MDAGSPSSFIAAKILIYY